MKYVDAGYAISLSVLFAYGILLIVRRRRLERAVSLAERTEQAGPDPHTGGDR